MKAILMEQMRQKKADIGSKLQKAMDCIEVIEVKVEGEPEVA